MSTTSTQNGRLQGKTAVITGASTGLGFETARQFLAQGARVIITGQNEARLAAAADKLGAGVVAVHADVLKLADLERLAERTKAEFDKLDILFANAGLGGFAPIEGVDEATFDLQFDTNVKGLFFTVQKLSPLLKQGSSVILNASAVQGKGAPYASVYFATKAAVRSFARTFAAELAPRGIRVNALSPGLVPTQFLGRAGVDDQGIAGFEAIMAKSAPLARVGRPEEVAATAVFLASDESSYITAADLLVDGGYASV
ncbi:SDR family oxidoreductase [Sorangium sp. So ce861]|uniref:SDR family oxidoreductase n=1 Tax=Sorangium sp. So ce861 TaxID=3133323 RepID=UPI003F635DF7